jgi:hypothetical protein
VTIDFFNNPLLRILANTPYLSIYLLTYACFKVKRIIFGRRQDIGYNTAGRRKEDIEQNFSKYRDGKTTEKTTITKYSLSGTLLWAQWPCAWSIVRKNSAIIRQAYRTEIKCQPYLQQGLQQGMVDRQAPLS